VPVERQGHAAHAARPLGGAQGLEIRRLPGPRQNEIAQGHVAKIVGDDAPGVVGPAKRTADADASAHVLAPVEIQIAARVEDVEADADRGVAEPGLRVGELEVASLAAPLDADVDALALAEEIVVAQL